MTMTVYYARQPLPETCDGPSIFLIGPTPRDNTPSWRNDALRILAELGYTGTVFVPEDAPPDGEQIGGVWNPETLVYEDQTRWEWAAIGMAHTVASWVPRELKAREFIPTKPGIRGFIQACLADWAMRWGVPVLGPMPAMTTNVEYGAMLAPQVVSKLLLGAPEWADKVGYLKQVAREYALFAKSWYNAEKPPVTAIPFFKTLESLLATAAARP